MLNKSAVEIPTLQSTSVFLTSSDSWRDVEAFFRNAEPQRRAAKHFGHTWYISGNVLANPVASSSAPYPQELHQWNSSIEEPLHSFTVEKSEKQTPVQDQRLQSGPSAKDSVIFSGGDYSKIYGADQQRLQISDLHVEKIPHTRYVSLSEDNIQDWGMYLSQFPTKAMHWIKVGHGWFSGWFNVFVICKRNSNAAFWSTRCEDCFSTAQNRP